MVYKTTDMKAISNIINHPKVFKWVTDDLSPDTYVPDEKNLYIMNEEKTGVIRVDRFNGVTCMVHTSALPQLWGRTSEFVKEAIEWGWRNTLYLKVITLVPEFNPLAAKLCRDCGLKKEGVIKKSFLKNFKLYDQTIYGLSKYEEKGETQCQY